VLAAQQGFKGRAQEELTGQATGMDGMYGMHGMYGVLRSEMNYSWPFLEYVRWSSTERLGLLTNNDG